MRGHVESSEGHAKRLAQLGAAFAAHRRGGRGKRISEQLRDQAVSALAAGVSPGAVRRVCHISWTQLSCWRDASRLAVEPRAGEARVLSVVESTRCEVDGGEIEIRVGGLRLSIKRIEG